MYKKISFGGGYLRLTSSCVECSFIILVKLSAENNTKPELNSNKQNKQSSWCWFSSSIVSGLVSLKFFGTSSHYCKIRCLNYWQCTIQGGRGTEKGARESQCCLPLLSGMQKLFPRQFLDFIWHNCVMTNVRRSGKWVYSFYSPRGRLGRREGIKNGYWISQLTVCGTNTKQKNLHLDC